MFYFLPAERISSSQPNHARNINLHPKQLMPCLHHIRQGFFLLHIFFEFISMPLSLPETNRFLHLKKNEGEEMLGILFYFPFQFGWFLGFHGNFQGVVRSCSEGIFQPVKVFKPPFLPSFRLVKSVRPLYILVVSVQISARFLKKLGFFLLRSKKTTWMREYTKNI